MKTQGNLVGISLGAYASMVGDGGSFPGAELFGLVALRNAWTTRNALRKGARQSFSKTQTWRNLELGAGRGRLARYTAELGHRLQPEGDVSVTLLEPVVEQNPQLVEVLSQLESQGAIAQGILNHCTFGQFLDERETGRRHSMI